MALNYVWIVFFVVGLVIALFRLIVFHDYEIFKKLVEGIFDASKSSVMDIGLPLTGAMVFFMGLMNIGEKAGAVQLAHRDQHRQILRLGSAGAQADGLPGATGDRPYGAHAWQ